MKTLPDSRAGNPRSGSVFHTSEAADRALQSARAEKALDFSPEMRYYFQDKFQADHLTGETDHRIP